MKSGRYFSAESVIFSNEMDIAFRHIAFFTFFLQTRETGNQEYQPTCSG